MVDQSTVINCYAFLDIALDGKIHDFTDGKYVDDRNDDAGYEEAQKRQADYLLDEIKCRKGSRILDIGCGYGRILKQAGERGAEAIGITISPSQVKSCRKAGLDVRLLNYKDIPYEWDGKFDGIVANGSLEHFVQYNDLMEGRADAIYKEMFAICQRLLKPGGRFVTTSIHCWRERPMMQNVPSARREQEVEYNYWNLQKAFAGTPPAAGQLEKCAQPYFKLTNEEDGTHDYYLTSEYWLRTLKRRLILNPIAWCKFIKRLAKNPSHTIRWTKCFFLDESWNWQFRGPNPPTRLLRQTWERVD